MKSSDIKKLLEEHGIEWFAVNEYADDEAWTLSQVENENGWTTDTGLGGYGFPKDKAEYFSRLPKLVDQLLKQNEMMRETLKVSANRAAQIILQEVERLDEEA